MTVCACGRKTNDGRPACDRCSAFALFGLARDASQAGIKEAYRVLAKVWHPDRFQGDEDLRRKAEEKLKEINSAYQLLTTAEDKSAYRPPPSPGGVPHAAEPASERRSYRPVNTRPVRPPFRMRRRASRRKWLAVPAVVVIACGIWLVLRNGTPTMWYFWQTGTADHSTAVSAGDGPAKGAGAGSAKPATNGSTVSAQNGAHNRLKPVSPRASLVEYPSDDPLAPYFTVGSTRDDVLRVQGAPNKTTGNLSTYGVLTYGQSQVYFRYGRVESWHTDPTTPLKARMPQ